jgi:hypothetical protein
MALMQGFMAGLQSVHRAALGVVGDEPLLGDGVLVGGERRVELHVCAYDLQENVQLQNRQLKKRRTVIQQRAVFFNGAI